MSNKLNLSRVRKCDQYWSEMPVCKNGRTCMKCQNVIHDFRGLTDLEIAQIHNQNEKDVCGIYDEGRIGEYPIEKNKTAGKKINKLLQTTFLGLIFINPLSAKEQAHVNKIEIHEKTYSDKPEFKHNYEREVPSRMDSVKFVKGLVTDEYSEPLIGLSILIKNTSTGTVTDLKGNYNLIIPDDFFESDTLVLIYSYTGYGREEKTINLSDLSLNDTLQLDVSLKENSSGLQVFGIIANPPLHKRVWYRIKTFFRRN